MHIIIVTRAYELAKRIRLPGDVYASDYISEFIGCFQNFEEAKKYIEETYAEAYEKLGYDKSWHELFMMCEYYF